MAHSSKANVWYLVALAYFTGTAITGMALRHIMPEAIYSQDNYFSYMLVLTLFWPVTWIAMTTNGDDIK